MTLDSEEFDFIVVGGGPAGCCVASALARSKSRPSVLLLEAGGDNSDPVLRHLTGFRGQKGNPEYNWGYVTEPVAALNGRRIDMERGRGLGGCTAINESLWLRGSRDDWDEVARITGNETWNWENVERRYRQLENYHLDFGTTPEIKSHFTLSPDAYGRDGPIHLSSWEAQWNSDMFEFARAWEACGHPINPDPSGGNPIGVTVSPLSSYNGRRSTSADVLGGAPSNLRVATDSLVHRVIFEGQKAIGIGLANGKVIKASKEIILSAGAIDTPKILLHSGIGPSDQLAQFNIPVVHSNEHVGQNLRDHYFITMIFTRPDKEPSEGIATFFLKNDEILSSPEFKSLPEHVQTHIKRPTIAAWEARQQATAILDWGGVTGPVTRWAVFTQHNQGKGEVVLQSPDPTVPPLIRASYLDHPFDKRVTIEATRAALRVVDQLMKRGLLLNTPTNKFPRGDSEEDILTYWRENLGTGGHESGTCKTGKSQERDGAVVDPYFKVFSVEGLRVADMSVTPYLLNAHPQTYAYQIGMMAGEMIVKEHGLDD
ncbi:hypothetical protein F5884DRAFT_899662 [Xylogone sp. PMI_703]|nr:hypothetical protein F5884DRAFT_899662 [Xylogone sp. PMI_703]